MLDTPSSSADGRHECRRCGKRLARLNKGPWCYACQETGETPELSRLRPRRARLPHDLIMARFREVGDTSTIARELGLARSSVWYVIERAKHDGRLPQTVAGDDAGEAA